MTLASVQFLVFLTAVWLLIMRWREQRAPVAPEGSKLRFNAVQVALALLTVFTIATLVFSGIRNGLLSAPDMGLRSSVYDSHGQGFWWFEDQTAGVLETPSIYSVPMGAYRVLMLAWAVWIAFALVRWLRWAFNAWKTDGLWR